MNLIPWRNKRQNGNGGIVQNQPLSRLRNEMEQAFERFWRDPWHADLSQFLPAMAGLGPRINLAESDDDVTVTAELPGVDPKDVDINIGGNMLTIRGEKKEEAENKKRNYHYMERTYGSFQRSVQLPNYVDPDKVDAHYKNGVLTIALQKRPDARPKRVAVKTV